MESTRPVQPRVQRAWAKVNLYLEVVGRRADSYHELDSLVVFAGCGDRLSLRPAPQSSFSCTGPFADQLAGESNNLVRRALDALARAVGPLPHLAIELEKNLPVAAGLGGGSADGAATLEALLALTGAQIAPKALQELALSLGADLPVCLFGRPALVSGIGERIERAPPLPAAWLVLVNSGDRLATPAVFQARQGPFSQRRPWHGNPLDAVELALRLGERNNDLEPPARRLAPTITRVLERLAAEPACLLARMSGSGATCFGLFARATEARQAAARIAGDQPAWWVAPCPILHGKLARHWNDRTDSLA